MPKKNIKNEIQKEMNQISDTVDYEGINQQLKDNNISSLALTKKTLMNISKWALDGKSDFEIRQNLELSIHEWEYLLKLCPAIVVVMQHSQAYADIVLTGSLFQTAIGGKKVKKRVPMHVKEYAYDEEKGRSYVCGEHIEMVEYDEELPPNPLLLKFLAENKLSENFGNKKKDNSKEYREIVDALTPEQVENMKEYAEVHKPKEDK